jgi:RHS repeat-associated protein
MTFGYSDAGRLTSVSGTATASHVHNAMGERVKKVTGGATTYFVFDEAGHLIGEYDGSGNLVQETVWLHDIPVATLRPNGSAVDIYYVHTDHLNTPRRITRPSDDAIVWSWDSDPFGTTAADEDPDGDETDFIYHLRFPGQYLDEETGLHYNYFRDYDPVTGRYVQSDPAGLSGGINAFTYALANPASFVDVLGLYADCITYTKQRFPRSRTVEETFLEKEWHWIQPYFGGAGVGPNLDPIRPKQSPVMPELRFDLWWVLNQRFHHYKWIVNEDVLVRHVFCVEKISGPCGEENTVITSYDKEDIVNSTETLIDDWRTLAVIPIYYLGSWGI